MHAIGIQYANLCKLTLNGRGHYHHNTLLPFVTKVVIVAIPALHALLDRHACQAVCIGY